MTPIDFPEEVGGLPEEVHDLPDEDDVTCGPDEDDLQEFALRAKRLILKAA